MSQVTCCDDEHVNDALRGPDLWSYGFKENLHDLETLKRHLNEQNLLQQDFPIEEAFAPSTLETFRQ